MLYLLSYEFSEKCINKLYKNNLNYFLAKYNDFILRLLCLDFCKEKAILQK